MCTKKLPISLIPHSSGSIFVLQSTRLAGGRVSSEGRLEVYHSGRWGTVCDDNFGANDATAICVMLGFMSGVMQSSVAGPGSGTIWMDEVGINSFQSSSAEVPSLLVFQLGDRLICGNFSDTSLIS